MILAHKDSQIVDNHYFNSARDFIHAKELTDVFLGLFEVIFMVINRVPPPPTF